MHHTLAWPSPKKRKRIAVHILVARTFHGPRPDGLVVAHLDGDKANNCADNLSYVSHRQNIEHKRAHGTMICGDRSRLSKLTDHQCVCMLGCLDAGYTRREVANAFGVSVAHVYALKSGRIRKHLRDSMESSKRKPTNG
jgi:hypothetical protein